MCHCLFVFEFVYAKDGLPKASPNLGVQGIDESGCSGCVSRFGSQAHMNLAQLHLRQQTNSRVRALFDQIIQGLIDVALRQPHALERA